MSDELSKKGRAKAPHEPPKNDLERLENIIEGLMDFDDEELPSLEETNAHAKAAGIDFAAWGEEIRKKAQAELRKQQANRIAEALAAREKAVERIEARPRPAGTREEKIALLRSLVKKPGGERLAAHFKNFDEASDAILDEMILSFDDVIAQAKNGKKGD